MRPRYLRGRACRANPINNDQPRGQLRAYSRRFLRQIVPDAARDHPVRICAREFCGISTGVRVRRPLASPSRVMVGTEMTGPWASRFSSASYCCSPCQTKAPAIVMHHDADMIRIVEGRRGTSESGIIEVPLRRCELPDELSKFASVFLVASLSALGGEIKLVPPFELRPLAAAVSC